MTSKKGFFLKKPLSRKFCHIFSASFCTSGFLSGESTKSSAFLSFHPFHASVPWEAYLVSGEKKTELGMRVWGSSRGWGNPLGGREGRLEQQPWILGGIGGRDWGSSKVGG